MFPSLLYCGMGYQWVVNCSPFLLLFPHLFEKNAKNVLLAIEASTEDSFSKCFLLANISKAAQCSSAYV